jgi:hypothetical protein
VSCAWIEKLDDFRENVSINQPVKFVFFKNFKIFEIKNSKKTRVDFKIFGENIIQKFEVTHPTKIREGKK